MSDLPTMLTPDTIPVVLKRLGIQLKGDAELNMLAGGPQRICDQLSCAAISTVATDAGFSAGDATTLTEALVKSGAGLDDD
jgi:hypothetical protein